MVNFILCYILFHFHKTKHFLPSIEMVVFVLSSLSSYPWSTGEDGREIEERSRSISWSGQVGSSIS